MMKHLKDQRGVTLFEVVASLVIITIVLISFSQLFVQSNKTAKFNNEKLVLINLADAELERIQATPHPQYSTPSELIDHIDNSFSRVSLFNTHNYSVDVESGQDLETITNSTVKEKDVNLINVKVTVSSCSNSTEVSYGATCIKESKSSTEGYVSFE